MKNWKLIPIALAFFATFKFSSATCSAATTINSTNKFSYGANIGWINWAGNDANGAVIGEYVCSGYIYSANVGWINLGSDAPTNGIQYRNTAPSDFGVNHDGEGNLRGFAYGANIGWINFESNGKAKVNLSNGHLSGSVYSANCGWISLSNAFAFVQTDTIRNGTDSDLDGMADAWERLKFGNLAIATAITDFDQDGMTDAAEYGADTDPQNALDFLQIHSYDVTFINNGFDTDSLNWSSRPTRKYRFQFRNALDANSPWTDTGFVFPASAGTNTEEKVTFSFTSAQRFFRVEAIRLLP